MKIKKEKNCFVAGIEVNEEMAKIAKQRCDKVVLGNAEQIKTIDFPKDLDLSVVDKNSSPLFLFQIVSTGQCIYQSSEKEKVSFEAFTLGNYYDTAHLRKIYYSYLKDKFSYVN